ncbi:hypothetical protein [Viridibacillus arvi]|uniref:hypothetical protein n=1 Tax=Viridibacillus arvi TaxID=263475 RepID=UPI003CFF8712
MNKATVKRNDKRIVILIVMLFISVLIFPIDKGYACSCSQPDPPKEALKSSSAVFSGKLLTQLIGTKIMKYNLLQIQLLFFLTLINPGKVFAKNK